MFLGVFGVFRRFLVTPNLLPGPPDRHDRLESVLRHRAPEAGGGPRKRTPGFDGIAGTRELAGPLCHGHTFFLKNYLKCDSESVTNGGPIDSLCKYHLNIFES